MSGSLVTSHPSVHMMLVICILSTATMHNCLVFSNRRKLARAVRTLDVFISVTTAAVSKVIEVVAKEKTKNASS